MNKIRLLALAACVAVSSVANADVINFQYLADNVLGESAYANPPVTSTLPPALAPNALALKGSTTGATVPSDVLATSLANTFMLVTSTAVDSSGNLLSLGGLYGNPYLDSGNAGLGVCGNIGSNATGTRPGNTSNLCNPSSDDNVSFIGSTSGTSEQLTFLFTKAVHIGNIYLNNNHDGDRSLAGDAVFLGANGTLSSWKVDSTGGDHINFNQDLAAGQFFTIGYNYDNSLTCGGEGLNGNNCQFYVGQIDYTTSVPAPESLGLLGLGFIALGWLRKRFS